VGRGQVRPEAFRQAPASSQDQVHERSGGPRHGGLLRLRAVRESWRLCVIADPRDGGALVAAGHVEADEDPPTTVVRQILAETGHRVRLLPPPLPQDTPPSEDASVWRVVPMPAAADNWCDWGQVRRESTVVGVVDRPFAVCGPAEHAARWVERGELDRLRLPEGTRALVRDLFDVIDQAVAVRPRPGRDEELRAELLRRQAEDQAVRLVPAAERTPELYERWRAVDVANTAWLRAVIRSHGWPGASMVGPDTVSRGPSGGEGRGVGCFVGACAGSAWTACAV
jgi:ADP-ribose pyrophosphatase YjhB (NUDIX family)